MIRRDLDTLDGRPVAELVTGDEQELRAELARDGYQVAPLEGLAAPILQNGVRIGRLAPASDGRAEARLDIDEQATPTRGGAR
jgi:hypothetical protein